MEKIKPPRYTWKKRRSYTELHVDGEYTGLETRSAFLERKDYYGHLAERMETVVRACNAHDGLVIVTQNTIDMLERTGQVDANKPLYDHLKVALAKAEGR